MKRALLSSMFIVSLIAAANASPFACPRVGGDLVHGMETSTDTLDQMASATTATRDIAMKAT